MKQLCDAKTGQCVCKEGYTGRMCDYCAIGYYGHPICQKCNCDASGSKNLPGYDIIDCDDQGQCPCKELTTGLKCNECRQSTFGLSQNNPSGCTRCFCFGRSQDCAQNPLIWGLVRLMGPRNVTVHYITDYHRSREDIHYVVVTHIRNNQMYRVSGEISVYNGLSVFPDGNVTIATQRAFYKPFYFQLPKEFLGDKTSSYGGFLNFSVITEGCASNLDDETLRQFPIVQLQTHYKLILDYYHPEAFNWSSVSQIQTFNVVLHESYWRYHANGYNISRAIMMTALQNMKRVLLRASSCPDFSEVV